jgi:hypothetical protein
MSDHSEEIERLQRQNDLLTLNNQNLAIDPRILAFEGRIKELETTASIAAKEYARQISQQQVRITALEAEIAVMRGTLSRYDEPDDQPIIVHDVPPDAPR